MANYKRQADRPPMRNSSEKEIQKLERAVDRLARQTQKLAETLRRLKRASGTRRPAGESRMSRKK
jgi:hypothetical protein